MANTVAPRGFKPVRYVDGRPYNGAVTTYRIASGYAANIFYGDVVALVTSGYVQRLGTGGAGAFSGAMRGVAVGFKWVGASGVPQYSQYWPSGTVTLNSADAEVMVVDDPGVVFEAQFVNSSSVPAVSDIGGTFNSYDTAGGGLTATGISVEGVDYATAGTSLAQWRFIEFVKRPDNDLTTANSRGYFVPINHDFRLQAGI